MNRKSRGLVLALLLAIGAAACDGGSSGTGIATTAQGNVASVSSARHAIPASRQPPTMLARVLGMLRFEREASALGPLEGIRVTIEGTSIETQTDAAGLFSLRGNFAGPVGMLLELPEGGSSARLLITVPRGGELTVTNVHVDARSGQATADSQHVRFGGLVNGTNCSQPAATMVSRETPNDGNTYTVDLGSASVRDRAGNPLGCANLTSGESVDVDGEVGGDGEVEARSVEVEEGSGGGDGGGGMGSGEGSGDRGGATSGEDGSGSSGGGGSGGEESHKSGGEPNE